MLSMSGLVKEGNEVSGLKADTVIMTQMHICSVHVAVQASEMISADVNRKGADPMHRDDSLMTSAKTNNQEDKLGIQEMSKS